MHVNLIRRDKVRRLKLIRRDKARRLKRRRARMRALRRMAHTEACAIVKEAVFRAAVGGDKQSLFRRRTFIRRRMGIKCQP